MGCRNDNVPVNHSTGAQAQGFDSDCAFPLLVIRVIPVHNAEVGGVVRLTCRGRNRQRRR
jgi:hypothetical protein